MDFSLSWERGKMYLSWKYERERERERESRKECATCIFFLILLSWESIMGGNTIVIVIWLAHTPITDCQISKSVKSIIKFSVYLDFLYSTLLWNLLWLCESVRESARKKRKRGKIQFWTSYYKFSNRPDYYRPTFFITITFIVHCCMGLGLQYASENGQPRRTLHPMSGRVKLRCSTLPAASVLQRLGAQFSCKIMVLFCSRTNYTLA